MKKLKSINENSLQDEILSELWENAAFDPATYALFEKLTIALHKQNESIENSSTEVISEEGYFEISTLRNRNLVTSREQESLKKAVVGFFGLSVGSHAALTWVMQSRSDVIKIADPDTIAPTNLNRLRTGWQNVGTAKVDDVTQKIKAIHPYTSVISTMGVDYDDMKKIFDASPPIDVVVDEIDDLVGKIWLRKLAKERRIPLISATDVGDNVQVDIERYDISPQPKPFLGRIVDLDPESDDFSNLSLKERVRLTMQIIGFEVCSEAMLDSLLAIAEELKTWPQLGATATLSGGVLATTLKKIILKEQVNSGRYKISLDELLVADYDNTQRKDARSKKIQQFKSKYNM